MVYMTLSDEYMSGSRVAAMSKLCYAIFEELCAVLVVTLYET